VILRDSVVSIDPALAAAATPTSTEAEFESYIWAKPSDGRALKEAPVKLDDHGLDALRYGVMYLDGGPSLPYEYLRGHADRTRQSQPAVPAPPTPEEIEATHETAVNARLAAALKAHGG